ncbi:MAG: flagellar basal-body MS-ring/collar protein FliF [Pseudomonadota bacterium]
MQQLSVLWMTMDVRRKAMLVGGVAALVVVVFILARVATTPGMALLYSGLDDAAAGEVVAALEARGVAHEVRGGAIFVDQAERDALRMTLAGEGLPANGSAGYELLDGLQGFGTTAQMFDAAYWRAKEGELARTIVSSPMVRAARVHIANASSEPFATRNEVTASVTLRPATGGIPEGFARAMQYMVASAVPGLQPANVTIIDADSGEVIGSDIAAAPGSAAEQRAEALRANIERLLTARVGPGNAMVEVNVELISERETILERRIDPASRVVISTDSEERSNTSQNAASGAVTVASNLPDGDAGGGAGESSEQGTETRERVNYDISETQREIEAGPERVRRISVAVLVNGVATVDATGAEIVEPRDATEIDALDALVRSAIGFDAERGDQVTIRSMAFEIPPEFVANDLPGAGLFSALDIAQLLRGLLLAVVAIAIVFGVLRPALAANTTASQAVGLPAPAGGIGDLPDFAPPAAQGSADGADGDGDGFDFGGLPSLPGMDGAGPAWDGEIITSSDSLGGGGSDGGPEDPVDRLRRLIQEREAETVEILRSWMEEDEEPTR